MSTRVSLTPAANGAATAWSALPALPVDALMSAVSDELAHGGRLCSLFGVTEDGGVSLVAVVAHDEVGTLAVGRSAAFVGAYPALTAQHAEAHLFEREVAEQHGVVPAGHPWLKPVRRSGAAGPGTIDFFRVDGREVHEVAVGPVHAGIIEPGHFRFQCAGEEVLHLEIALGYQHRGIEEALIGGPHRATRIQLETVAGDTSIAHASAYATVVEALAGVEAPLPAQWLRALALELERLANHVGDLGALAGDIAFLPTAAAFGRLRGDFLNLTALVCGNRFGRGLVLPGGCARDLEPERARTLRSRLDAALDEVDRAMEWLWDSATVAGRLERTGALTTSFAQELGLVGPAARACGLMRDVRYDHPIGWHRFSHIPIALWPDGDVFARARVRSLEIERSGAYLCDELDARPAGPLMDAVGALRPGHLAVALVEGWRGEVCHVALTDDTGRFRRYKVTDPSFHNWAGLAVALRGQAISDFPLCNKSFNLSYCGFDL